jgi:multidrug efflux pump
MVLAVGILVDDAIVVIENVERIMREEGLSPREATRKAMSQITAAIVGITVTLVSVFLPMAFFGGAVGNIYRQFSLVMVSAMLFSVFLALSLTPALCATLLKPVPAGAHHARTGFFGVFNRLFTRTTTGYEGAVAAILRRSGRFMVLFLAIVGVVVWMFNRLPTSFLPNEDQGFLLVNVQLPPGATQQRTLGVMQQMETFMLAQPEVQAMVSVMGFSFSGAGQNAGLAFVTLKDWSERSRADQSAQALAGRALRGLSNVRDAIIFPLSPPAIRELGNATGFNFRLQDRAGAGHDALLAARNQMLGLAGRSKVLTGVRPDGLEDAPQLQVEIDRDRANALGVSFESVNAVLSTALGSTYVNDFPNQGRLQRVVVQADAPARMQAEQILQLNATNAAGRPVPLAAFASTRWISGPVQTIRYNGYPTMRIVGDAAPGYSTGDALRELEALSEQLPAGFGFEWTGVSREEKLSGAQAFILLGFSLLAVFLCLAALYESWSIPFAVLLVVPLGILGALLGASWRGLPNDVFFKVGLIAVMGLSAKNAILIIEFAKDLHASGVGLVEATLRACRMRFRPILMTSLAFILGVLPLAVSTGAGSASQRAIGTGVMGGMISATVLAVLFVPVFFVVVRRVFKGGTAHPPVSDAGAGAPPPSAGSHG